MRGKLVREGWGSTIGYPALILDPAGEEIEVQIFECRGLASEWERLDDFEGADYRRVLTGVETSEGRVEAQIYVAAVQDCA